MRWKSKRKPNPKPGENRINNRFAWLPTRMTDNITVLWLEKYSVLETYEKANVRFGFFQNGRWVVYSKLAYKK